MIGLIFAIFFCAAILCCNADWNNSLAENEKSAASCAVTVYVLALQDDCKFGYDTIHGLWLEYSEQYIF